MARREDIASFFLGGDVESALQIENNRILSFLSFPSFLAGGMSRSHAYDEYKHLVRFGPEDGGSSTLIPLLDHLRTRAYMARKRPHNFKG